MEDITIESLIAQKRVVTTTDLLNPINDYMVVGVYQNGTSKSRGDGTSYKNYVISIAELLGGGAAYTASNGISLVGNDFRLTSNNISQFTNDSGYLLPAALTPYLTSATAALTYQPIGAYLTASTGWVLDGNTVGSEKFLGTIDNFALPFRVNNNEVLRITDDAAGSTRFYFNANTNLHGSNSGIQYSSDGTSPNRSQARFNLYGANTGAPGITGFKSRGATIGSTLSVLPGDNLFRITSIGVSGNDTSINLASLIDVRVSTVLVGHIATDFVVALNSIAGVMTERLYVNSEGDVGMGTSTPTARLQIIGASSTNADYALKVYNSTTPVFEVRNDGLVGVGGVNPFTSYKFHIQTSVANDGLQVIGGGIGTLTLGADTDTQSGVLRLRDQPAGTDGWVLRNIGDSYMVNSFNFGIGTGPTAKLHVRSNGSTTGYAFKVESTTPSMLFNVRDDGRINMGSLPLVPAGLAAGDLWNNAGVVNIV
jgi:hypothetical protein